MTFQPNKGKFYDPDYDNIRTQLPVPRKKVKFSIWEVLKELVGKDFSKFAVPGKYINLSLFPTKINPINTIFTFNSLA